MNIGYIQTFYILLIICVLLILQNINIYLIIDKLVTIIYIIKLVQTHKSKKLLLFIYNYFMINKSKQSHLSILYDI